MLLGGLELNIKTQDVISADVLVKATPTVFHNAQILWARAWGHPPSIKTINTANAFKYSPVKIQLGESGLLAIKPQPVKVDEPTALGDRSYTIVRGNAFTWFKLQEDTNDIVMKVTGGNILDVLMDVW